MGGLELRTIAMLNLTASRLLATVFRPRVVLVTVSRETSTIIDSSHEVVKCKVILFSHMARKEGMH
jgi:hypothetical protein